MRALVKHVAPLWGGDGSAKNIPHLGDIQGRDWNCLRKALEQTQPITRYATLLALLTSVLIVGLVAVGERPEGPFWLILVLAILAMAAERQPVRINEGTEVTVSVLPILFAAVAFGPLTAIIIGALGLVGQFRQPYARWMIWTCECALAAGLAGVAALLVGVDSRSFGGVAAAVVVATCVETAVDTLLAAGVLAARKGESWRAFLVSAAPISLVTVPLYAPVIILLVYAYEELSGWTILLFFGPAFAAHSLYRLYREQRRATDELRRVNETLERANISFAGALIAALDARDKYTAGHSAAVAVYAREIARELALPSEDQDRIHLTGLVHDIGKVGLPPGILEKPGALTTEERSIMEQHSVIGERILSRVEDYADDIAVIVRHHHERFDGGGYPDKLKGTKIPLMARIIAVADAYDAMTSARPYRDAMPRGVALARLVEGAGSQFDESVVNAFQRVLSTDLLLRSDDISEWTSHPYAARPALALVESA
jgi:putative nucleotidyltransferase with HDIG domain